MVQDKRKKKREQLTFELLKKLTQNSLQTITHKNDENLKYSQV